jgi:hypothetical protein
VDLSSPHFPPSNRCGSASKSTTRAARQSFTANASKCATRCMRNHKYILCNHQSINNNNKQCNRTCSANHTITNFWLSLSTISVFQILCVFNNNNNIYIWNINTADVFVKHQLNECVPLWLLISQFNRLAVYRILNTHNSLLLCDLYFVTLRARVLSALRQYIHKLRSIVP